MPFPNSPTTLSQTLRSTLTVSDLVSPVLVGMQSEQRRKRKRIFRPPFSLFSRFYSLWPLILCFCCFVFFLLHGFSIGSAAFRPVLIVSRLSLLSSSAAAAASNSIQDSGDGFLRVEDRVVFPDHVLLLVSKSGPSLLRLFREGGLDCVYQNRFLGGSDKVGEKRSWVFLPVLSVDDYDELRLIARCPIPASNQSAVVNLVERERKGQEGDDGFLLIDPPVHSWETVVYAAAADGETAVVFVKGLNLRPDRASDPTQFSCHFGWGDLQRSSSKISLTTKAVTAAQEVVRCPLPVSILKNPAKAQGIRVTVGVASHVNPNKGNPRATVRAGNRGRSRSRFSSLPSVAKISNSNSQVEKKNKNKYELCVCTMLWNQAPSLREWIIYHSWLGVERWFIYDNNSDDEIREVIDELEQEGYNVSRHIWPWIKTQEAGFSHCTLKARAECKWVGFMDVDEFFYFPISSPRSRLIRKLGYPGRNTLKTLVANFSSSTTIGEIRTACHSFGPSGLSIPPSQGVTVGYTCRLQSPERHKSIVRLDVLDDTLLNVVHHFRLKTGYKYRNLRQSTAVINHYKYQVWESFRAKFFRRVATYVTDWQENHNEGSKDRAPGLGTEAIEPPNWRFQFCEVWDTGLRDFVMANMADPASGMLPWERSSW